MIVIVNMSVIGSCYNYTVDPIPSTILQGSYYQATTKLYLVNDTYITGATSIIMSSSSTPGITPKVISLYSGVGPATIRFTAYTQRYPPGWSNSVSATLSIYITGNIDIQSPMYVSGSNFPIFGITIYDIEAEVVLGSISLPVIEPQGFGFWSFLGTIVFSVAMSFLVSLIGPLAINLIIGQVIPPLADVIQKSEAVCRFLDSAGNIIKAGKGIVVTLERAADITKAALKLSSIPNLTDLGDQTAQFCGTTKGLKPLPFGP